MNRERLAAVLAMLIEDGHITPQGARILTITDEQDRCGGCAGLGAHRRWCTAVVGSRAHRLGTAADTLDDCGDTIGASDPHLSALCWQVSSVLRVAAEQASSRQQDPT